MNDFPQLSSVEQADLRYVLSEADLVVTKYDGTHDAREDLLSALELFEAFVADRVDLDAAIPAETPKAEALAMRSQFRNAAEAALSRQVRIEPVTVDDYLDQAQQRFLSHLQNNTLPILTAPAAYNFIPTFGDQAVQTGSGAGMAEVKIEPRTAAVIALLAEHEVRPDDIIRYNGTVTDTQMRQVPYTLIQIPRLDREILVCDQVGEAMFVGGHNGRGLQGALYWSSLSKNQLIADGVHRIEMHDGLWQGKLIDSLLSDNERQQRQKKLSLPKAMPLNDQVILHHALLFYNKYNKLPSKLDGAIEACPSETWKNFSKALEQGIRGFTAGDYKGLGDFYNQWGLKVGGTTIRYIAEAASLRISHGQPHGLVRNVKVDNDFTIDGILMAWVKQTVANNHKPPKLIDPVVGYDNQKWNTVHRGLNEGLRGFPKQYDNSKGEYNSLNDLLLQHGLILNIGRGRDTAINTVTLQKAWQTIQDSDGKAHGLTRNPETKSLPITLDGIVLKVLKFYSEKAFLPRTTASQAWSTKNAQITSALGNIPSAYERDGRKKGLFDGLTAFYNALSIASVIGNDSRHLKVEPNLAVLAPAVEFAKAANWTQHNFDLPKIIAAEYARQGIEPPANNSAATAQTTTAATTLNTPPSPHLPQSTHPSPPSKTNNANAHP